MLSLMLKDLFKPKLAISHWTMSDQFGKICQNLSKICRDLAMFTDAQPNA